MTITTVYRTYLDGRLAYTGADLEAAITAWDAESAGVRAGGIAVAEYTEDLLQVRDGWILHVHDDGQVYLHPRVLREAAKAA